LKDASIRSAQLQDVFRQVGSVDVPVLNESAARRRASCYPARLSEGHIVRRSLLALLAIAAIAAPGLRMRGATQGTPVARALFAKRVVTTGVHGEFQDS
jgi:hypothetical protein